jgi:pimeloyl-ACP methyl ester carboxylesterase
MNHLQQKTVTDLVTSLKKMLDVLVDSPYHLLGSSVGGWIAQHFTKQYPDQVKSLIIANSFSNNQQLRRENLLSYWLSMFIPNPLLLRFFLRNIGSTITPFDESGVLMEYFKETVMGMGKRILRNRLSWSLEKIAALKLDHNIPKLILYTQDDPIISKTITASTISDYPEAQIANLPEGGHFPYLSHPEEYGKAVLKFLKLL